MLLSEVVSRQVVEIALRILVPHAIWPSRSSRTCWQGGDGDQGPRAAGRLRFARYPLRTTLPELEFDHQPSIDAQRSAGCQRSGSWRSGATSGCSDRRRRGQTHLAIALGIAATEAGLGNVPESAGVVHHRQQVHRPTHPTSTNQTSPYYAETLGLPGHHPGPAGLFQHVNAPGRQLAEAGREGGALASASGNDFASPAERYSLRTSKPVSSASMVESIQCIASGVAMTRDPSTWRPGPASPVRAPRMPPLGGPIGVGHRWTTGLCSSDSSLCEVEFGPRGGRRATSAGPRRTR
jgi:hypothetical protein